MLSRSIDHRESLLKNLATSVVLYEHVLTTEAKAKAVRPIVEHMITIGKGGGLTGYRRLLGMVFDRKAAKKIVEELGPRYRNVIGGYVVLTPAPRRASDGASMSFAELRGVKAGEEAAPAKPEVTTKAAEKGRPKPMAKPRRVPKSSKAKAKIKPLRRKAKR